MTFISKNPISAPKTQSPPSPLDGTRGLFPTENGWSDINDDSVVTSFVLDDEYVHTDNNYTDIDKESLNNAVEILDTKADKANTYTKTESDTALNTKADKQTEDGGFAGGAGASTGDGGAAGDSANSIGGGAVGLGAMTGDGFAGGAGARTYDGTDLIDAIQLGTGTNPNPQTLQIYGYQLMDADGSIPDARIPQLTAKADKSDTYTKAQALSMFAPNTTASDASITLTDHLPNVDFINYTLYGSPAGVGDLDAASGKYKLGIKMIGKNLFNITAMYGAANNAGAQPNTTYNNLIKSFSTNGFTINPSGETYAGGVSSAVPVPTGARYNYCLSFKYASDIDMGVSSNYAYRIIVQFYDDSMARIGYESLNAQCIGGVCEHRTTPIAWSTAKYFALTVLTRSTAINSDIVISDIQFEQGNTKTAFEPYKCEKAEWYQDTPLYADDYADYASQKIVQGGVMQSAVLPPLQTIDVNGTVSATTQAQPDNIMIKYYQEINKVIQNLKNAIIALGGIL